MFLLINFLSLLNHLYRQLQWLMLLFYFQLGPLSSASCSLPVTLDAFLYLILLLGDHESEYLQIYQLQLCSYAVYAVHLLSPNEFLISFYHLLILLLIFLQFSHLAWVQTDRKSGGLGDLNYPLISDVTKSISKSYGVLIPDQVCILVLALPGFLHFTL